MTNPLLAYGVKDGRRSGNVYRIVAVRLDGRLQRVRLEPIRPPVPSLRSRAGVCDVCGRESGFAHDDGFEYCAEHAPEVEGA